MMYVSEGLREERAGGVGGLGHVCKRLLINLLYSASEETRKNRSKLTLSDLKDLFSIEQ